MGHKVKTDFLVEQPSLHSGMARLFDFYGLYDAYNRCPDEAQADSMALLSDWMIVGDDIQSAMFEHQRLRKCT
jgi:hypothetical protein